MELTARYLSIEAKHRQMGGMHASLADFSVTSGDAISPDIVLHRPNISLYCLDDAFSQAILAELPPDVDLATVPFVYQTQYERAERLIAVPYDVFRQVARQLPGVDHLIMIYMTGRSGSTLLSQIFNELDTVLSLSEPDAATNFVHLRDRDGSRDAELRDLLDCVVRMIFKPTAFKAPSICALKLRSEGTQLMDLFQATFPQAKNVFLYRDAIGFVTSMYRLFTRMNLLPEYMPVGEYVALLGRLFNDDFTPRTAYLDEGTTEVSIPQFVTLWWLAIMEWYLTQHEQGVPALAVRYADLNAHPEAVVTEVFRYCGLPVAKAQETLGVFSRDAQAGTQLARDNPTEGNTLKLSDGQRAEVVKILQRHPVIKHSDFVVPGTLSI